jgi:hypothetical protein
MTFAASMHAPDERKRLAKQVADAREHALKQQAVMGERVARLAATDADKTGFYVIKVHRLLVAKHECAYMYVSSLQRDI